VNAEGIYRRYNEAENLHDWDTTSKLLSPEIQVAVNGLLAVSSPEEDSHAMKTLVTMFPDYRREIVQIICNEDRASIRWQMTGTSSLNPVGNLSVEGVSLIRTFQETIVEAFLFADSDELDKTLENAMGLSK
jgi:predicted ester cyclase